MVRKKVSFERFQFEKLKSAKWIPSRAVKLREGKSFVKTFCTKKSTMFVCNICHLYIIMNKRVFWGDDAESTTRFPQNGPIPPNPTQSNPISRIPIPTKLHFHLSCLPFRSHCKLFLCMTQCCQCLVSDGMCLNIFPFRLIVGVMNSSKRVMSYESSYVWCGFVRPVLALLEPTGKENHQVGDIRDSFG